MEEDWQRAADLQRLRAQGALAVKLGGRQVALFAAGEDVHACNNRCPHEGYPLAEGSLSADCVLTCHWHNWKFDLRSGANLYGGDGLRIFPTRVVDGAVWIDVADPPPAQRIAALLGGLDAAMDDNDAPRIAREAARLLAAGAGAESLLGHAIVRSHTRLRYGMTHAYAAAEVWLRLHDGLSDAAERLVCLVEALSHIAFDTLREPEHPYLAAPQRWDEAGFLAAVEAQDEAPASAHLLGAIDAGLGIGALEATLTRAALRHYSDFGHSLIYLVHCIDFAPRLGPQAERALLLAWLRALLFATREDLLPDFRAYAPALAAWPRGATALGDEMPDPLRFVGLGVRETLARTFEAARTCPPDVLAQVLLGAGAEHLRRFDARHAERSDGAVADNIGWLDFTHAITFARAMRRQCRRFPDLWPQGLLQLALFVGRNSAYLGPADGAASIDADEFDRRCVARLLDHGLQPQIFSSHLLKTWDATRGIIAPPAVQASVRAAVDRLFGARLKQRHALRSARQALAFVAREG